MGSFNYTGCFSNIPISYGDKIVAIVGLRRTKSKWTATERCYDHFAPGHSFIPVTMPIHGKYDDYGNIEDIEETINTKYIEDFFGEDISSLVSSIISDEAEEELKKIIENDEKLDAYSSSFQTILNSLNKQLKEATTEEDKKKFEELIPKVKAIAISSNSGDTDEENDESANKFVLDVIYEHENVFKTMLEITNTNLIDYEFWQIPEEFILALGYKAEYTGEERSYKLVTYTHDKYPTLKRNCYVWKEDEYKDYSHTIRTIRELYDAVGVPIPEEYNMSYFEYAFLKECEDRDSIVTTYGDDFYSFAKCSHSNRFGLFKCSEYYSTDYQLGIYHEVDIMKKDNAKEIAELAGLRHAMSYLSKTWGNSHYSSQDANWKREKKYLQAIMDVVDANIKKYEYDED